MKFHLPLNTLKLLNAASQYRVWLPMEHFHIHMQEPNQYIKYVDILICYNKEWLSIGTIANLVNRIANIQSEIIFT